METMDGENDTKNCLDDSGCVHDESPTSKASGAAEVRSSREVSILDLCDDVLLHILKYCSHTDLKAIGYTCERLGAVIRDHSLWQYVDVRDQPTGRKRLRWMVTYVLNSSTKELLMSGYAREARPCLGHVKLTRKEIRNQLEKSQNDDLVRNRQKEFPKITETDHSSETEEISLEPEAETPRAFDTEVNNAFDEDSLEVDPEQRVLQQGNCPGPQFTLTKRLLYLLTIVCPNLESLALEYCNINCVKTGILRFPDTLKKLSLKGSKCYNLPVGSSWLHHIYENMPVLEELDLSECDWLESFSILALSKIRRLRVLRMRSCCRLTDFISYASIVARLGFRTLEVLDVRGSPVSDSEMSALSKLPLLSELYLSPPPVQYPWPVEHSHYSDDELPRYSELNRWEKQPPPYFNQHVSDHSQRIQTGGMSTNPNNQSLKMDEPESSYEEVNMEADEESNDNTETQEKQVDKEKEKKKEKEIIEKEDDDEKVQTKKEELEKQVGEEKAKRETQFEQVDKGKEETQNVNNGNQQANKQSQELNGNERKRRVSTDIDPGEGPSTEKKPKNYPNTKTGDESDSEISDDDVDNYSFGPELKEENTVSEIYHERPDSVKRLMYRNFFQDNRTNPRLVLRECACTFGADAHMAYPMLWNNCTIKAPLFYCLPRKQTNAEQLITDLTLTRFGKSRGETLNYVRIGPRGLFEAPPPLPGEPGSRPDKSILRVLSVTGYSSVTDRSLEHLATSAPDLRFLDVSGTKVSQFGVETFRSLRPDCEVVFKPTLRN